MITNLSVCEFLTECMYMVYLIQFTINSQIICAKIYTVCEFYRLQWVSECLFVCEQHVDRNYSILLHNTCISMHSKWRIQISILYFEQQRPTNTCISKPETSIHSTEMATILQTPITHLRVFPFQSEVKSLSTLATLTAKYRAGALESLETTPIQLVRSPWSRAAAWDAFQTDVS